MAYERLPVPRKAVTIQCDHVAPIVYNYFPNYVVWLGTIQVVGGVALFAIGIAAVTLGAPFAQLSFALVLLTCLAGAFGIAAGQKKRMCQVTTSMIFSILTAVDCCAVVVVTANLLYLMTQMEIDATSSFHFPESDRIRSEIHLISQDGSGKGILILILVTALIEAIASIVLSCVGCHFSCFCCKKCWCDLDTTTTQQVVMIANDEESHSQCIVPTTDVELCHSARVNSGWLHQTSVSVSG